MKKLRVFVPVSVVVALVLLLMAPAGALAAPNQGAKRGGCEEWYRVRRGDTLAHIARVHGTSVWKLAEINDIEDPDLIYAGTSLCVDSDNGGWKADDNGGWKADDNGRRKANDNGGWKADDNGRRKADDNGGWKADDNGHRKADDNGRRKGDDNGGCNGWNGGCNGWNGNSYPYWSGTWNDGWNDGWNGN